jgi:hypothetical protein
MPRNPCPRTADVVERSFSDLDRYAQSLQVGGSSATQVMQSPVGNSDQSRIFSALLLTHYHDGQHVIAQFPLGLLSLLLHLTRGYLWRVIPETASQIGRNCSNVFVRKPLAERFHCRAIGREGGFWQGRTVKDYVNQG